MKALLLITTWVWWTVMIVSALECPSVIEETKKLHYSTVTFNFEDATTDGYSRFVNSLRNEVKSKEVFGIPVTAETVTDSKRYVLVELKIDSQRSITLGIDVIDLYVVGYRDRFQQKDRANFLSDAPAVAKANLFKGATVREIRFKGTYTDLESKAGTGRENIELGVNKLEYAANSVYGKSSVDSRTEARFFIIAIQMVSEAARFEYILEKVLQGGIYGSYKPDPKALSLETNWAKISTAIQSATANGKLSQPITLKDANGQPWTVKEVNDIKKDMGLLKFYKKQKGQASLFSQLMQMAYI